MNKKLSFFTFTTTIYALLVLMMSCSFDKPESAITQDDGGNFEITKSLDISFTNKNYFALQEYENGNEDGLASPGESLYLDVKFKNNGNKQCSKLTVKLSSKSQYVTIVRDSCTIDEVYSKYYSTLTEICYPSESLCTLMSYDYLSKAFKIKISNNCPDQYQIPFVLSFSDSNGYTTNKDFSITVYKSQARIVFTTENYYKVHEYENGNGDWLISPGESLYLDVKVQNVGTSNALGVEATLSTTSNYVTLIRDSCIIGDMLKANYYTLTDYSSIENSCIRMNYYTYQSKAFKFSVSSDCPIGTNIPFDVSFTDSCGNVTTLSFSIPVYSSLANIELVSEDNYKVLEYANGNGDGLITPGESLYLDVKVQNTGSSDALGVEAKLTTTSNYVTIIRDSCTIGNMEQNYYYTLSDCSVSVSACKLMYSYYQDKVFIFSLSIDCPAGTYIPFVITYTDSLGNTWTNNLKLLVSNVTGTLNKKLWGSWIKMDTGTEYYIDTVAVYESYLSNKKYSKSSYQVSDFTFDGDNIIRSGSSVFFRKGGSARGFTMNVAGFSDSESYRAMSSSRAGIVGYRKNKNNQFDEESAVSADDGKISFTNAVADDVQEVSVSSGTMDSSISVAPAYDGQNIGTIPLVEPDMYGFKTTYSIDGDNQGFCYGNSYKNYNLNLQINNIGSETCKTSVYEISCEDPKLTVVSGGLTGNFSSVEPGKSKTITLSVKYGTLTQEYIDVPVSISITDSKYARTWNDTVTIRFYKGVVSLKVNARNFEGSGATLKGFLIYPDGRSKRFTVSAGSTQTVLVPWSSSDYILSFSGATTSSELAYSFAFVGKANVADLSGTWSISDINAYENNDSYTNAYSVTSLALPVKAYLSYEDIDFYKVNVSNVELVTD